jgi:hypothetical protein
VKATIAGETVTALVTVLITEGKGSNHNYILYSDCNPVTNLKVKIHVGKDLAGSSGFSFQLNAYSAVNNPLMCNFQQYILTLSNPPPITLNGFIEYWPSPNTSVGNLTNSNTSLFPPAGFTPLPSFKIPRNSEFGMILKTDPNNRNAVTAVDWFVNDFPNEQNIMLPINSQTLMTSLSLLHKSTKTQKKPTESPFLSQDLIPFVAFQLNLVGAEFASGAGRIT